MALTAKVRSFRLSRLRAQQHGRAHPRRPAPSQGQNRSRGQAEAAFLDAIRGGQPAPSVSQVRALDDVELTRVADRLQRLRSECGCKAGAWSMTAALIIAPIVAVVHGASGPAGMAVLALLCAVSVAGAAVAGKVITIAAYRLRWRIERHQVLRQLAERGTDRDVILR
jgi:hypothetical protein